MDKKITFFMIVTSDDLCIADYAVKSYSKLKNMDFKLLIYSNYVDPILKKKYFTKWGKYPFVEIIKNDHQDGKSVEIVQESEGYFEPHGVLLDRELKKIDSCYIATVDADFEILRPNFVYEMIKILDFDTSILGISTDYNPNQRRYISFINRWAYEYECWNTWFILYRKSNIDWNIPMLRTRKEDANGDLLIWDTCSYFQIESVENKKLKLQVIDKKYQNQFIHYGAFAKNIDLNGKNIWLYRFLSIIQKNGIANIPFSNKIFGSLLKKIIFSKADKNRRIFHFDRKKTDKSDMAGSIKYD